MADLRIPVHGHFMTLWCCAGFLIESFFCFSTHTHTRTHTPVVDECGPNSTKAVSSCESLTVCYCGLEFSFTGFERSCFSVGEYAVVNAWDMFVLTGSSRCWSDSVWAYAIKSSHPAKELMQVCVCVGFSF